jgi:glyoxylase I family protein
MFRQVCLWIESKFNWRGMIADAMESGARWMATSLHQTSHMITLSHLGICVVDADVATRFYCEVFGFRKGGRFKSGTDLGGLLGIPGDLEFFSYFVSKDGVLLEFLQFPKPGHMGSREPRPMNMLGFTHLSFRVEEIDSVAAKIVEFGGAVLESSRTTRAMPGGYVEEVIFTTDPDGTRIELLKLPRDIQFS